MTFKTLPMILFTYKYADILRGLQTLASHRVNTLLAKMPEAVDDIAINEVDDAEMLSDFFQEGCGKVIGVLSGYTINLYDIDGITPLNAIDFINEVVADPLAIPPVVGVDASVILRINEPVLTFKYTVTPMLDQSIGKAIKNYILYAMYKAKGHDFDTWFDDYNQAISDILGYVNQRTKVVTRSFRMF